MRCRRVGIAIGVLAVAGSSWDLQEEWGKLLPAQVEHGIIMIGERLIFSPMSANLSDLKEDLVHASGLRQMTLIVAKVGPETVEVGLDRKRFTQDQVIQIRKVAKEHHDQRVAAGLQGIEGIDSERKGAKDEKRKKAPVSWRQRYATAASDPQRVRVIAEYLELVGEE